MRGTPSEFSDDEGVVGVTAADAQGAGDVFLGQEFAGDGHGHVRELVDGYYFVGADVHRAGPVKAEWMAGGFLEKY